MRLLVFLIALIAAPAALAQTRENWIVVADMWGNNAYSTLNLTRTGEVLSGDLDGDPLQGTIKGKTIRFVATDRKGATYRYDGKVTGAAMTGTADFADNNHPERRALHRFTGRRLPERPAGAARIYDFVPSDYSNAFSADRAPVLTIWPGDTVRTTTIDSGGMDETGTTRALFGNPQTGPFFVAGAESGDTLVIHIRKLRLNRDWADSLDTIVGRALGTALVARAGELGKPVRWNLDRERGLARPDGAGGRLKDYAVPVRPMLGGLGVAPGFGSPPLSTGDTARTGGNMDFPEIAEGSIVYLPVQQPGALLYLGDAHALQGDGETSQYALETSMAVEFSVDLVKKRTVSMPRVESATEIMVLGQAGSLDEALKAASTGLTGWLLQDYGLTLSEAAQVLGSAMRYSVPNLAGRSVGVAARLDKALLPPRLPRP